METRTYKVYPFAELSALGKEKAIHKFRENNLDYEWWEHVYVDAKEVGTLMGISIDKIYFSGFCSQGDGACFEGHYSHSLGSTKKIIAYAPEDTTLHEISRALSILQKPYFYQLEATIVQKGQYSHENCTEIGVTGNWEHGEYGYTKGFSEVYEAIGETLRDFMKWIYKRLESTYDYLQSAESIEETIEANEYRFTEDGEID